jgi:hypothetical protein
VTEEEERKRVAAAEAARKAAAEEEERKRVAAAEAARKAAVEEEERKRVAAAEAARKAAAEEEERKRVAAEAARKAAAEEEERKRAAERAVEEAAEEERRQRQERERERGRGSTSKGAREVAALLRDGDDGCRRVSVATAAKSTPRARNGAGGRSSKIYKITPPPTSSAIKEALVKAQAVTKDMMSLLCAPPEAGMEKACRQKCYLRAGDGFPATVWRDDADASVVTKALRYFTTSLHAMGAQPLQVNANLTRALHERGYEYNMQLASKDLDGRDVVGCICFNVQFVHVHRRTGASASACDDTHPRFAIVSFREFGVEEDDEAEEEDEVLGFMVLGGGADDRVVVDEGTENIVFGTKGTCAILEELLQIFFGLEPTDGRRIILCKCSGVSSIVKDVRKPKTITTAASATPKRPLKLQVNRPSAAKTKTAKTKTTTGQKQKQAAAMKRAACFADVDMDDDEDDEEKEEDGDVERAPPKKKQRGKSQEPMAEEESDTGSATTSSSPLPLPPPLPPSTPPAATSVSTVLETLLGQQMAMTATLQRALELMKAQAEAKPK